MNNIMVVDDNSLSLDSIYLSLKSHGFSVKIFESPKQALEAFKIEHFDAVLSDYYMQEMMGDVFLAKIRELNPKIRTILFSGNVSSKILAEKSKSCAQLILSKPLNIQKLILNLEKI